MTNWAPNVTHRARLTYRSAGLQHNAELRINRGANGADSMATFAPYFHNLFSALASLLPADLAFTEYALALADEDTYRSGFTLPVAVTGVQDVADYSPQMRAMRTTFKGMGGTSKVSISVYGVFWDLSDPAGVAGNGRVEASESTPISNAIAALNAGSAINSIANNVVNWYPFATVKVDDYWLKVVRRTYP